MSLYVTFIFFISLHEKKLKETQIWCSWRSEGFQVEARTVYFNNLPLQTISVLEKKVTYVMICFDE